MERCPICNFPLLSEIDVKGVYGYAIPINGKQYYDPKERKMMNYNESEGRENQ